MSARGGPALSPERWARVKAVLGEALALDSAGRAALLDRVGAGDPALRDEVESLLAADAQSDSVDGARGAVAAAVAALDADRGDDPHAADDADRVARLNAALADRYAVEGVLGRGGMATVYRARDLRHRRPVALKVLHAAFAAAVGQRRFLREIETAANLSHPHIVPLFDSGAADGLLYYVMPLVEGETLRERLRGRARAGEGPLAPADVARLVRALADALDYAHAHGVVHRDVKPENVLLDERGHPRLADFGVARAARPAGDGDGDGGGDGDRPTGAGVALGTPAYMSPEQVAGRGDVDGRSDQYGLACVAFELLAGGPAFDGPAESVFARRLTEPPPSVAARRSGLPAAADAVLRRALARAAGDRFATAGAFADALADALAGTLTKGAPAGPQPASPSQRRRRAWVAGGAVLFGGLLVGILVRARAGPGTSRAGDQPTAAPTTGGSLRDATINTARIGPAPRVRVLVRPFAHPATDAALSQASVGATDAIVRGLSETGLAEAVDAGASGTPSATGADLVVGGRVDREAHGLAFQLQVTDARDGTVLRSVTVTAHDPGVPAAVRERALGALATVVDPRLAALAAPRGGVPPTYGAYVELVEGLDAFYRLERVDALQHFQRAAAADSSFRIAVFYSAVAHAWLGQYAQSDSVLGQLQRARAQLMAPERVSVQWLAATLHGDLAGAYQASRELAHLAPHTPAPLQYAEDALALNRVGEAVRVLAAVDPDAPGLSAGVVHWHLRTLVLHLAGDYRGELDAARQGLARYPTTLQLLRAQARALAALGRAREVGPLVDAVAAFPAQPSPSPGDVLTEIAGELRAHGAAGEAQRVARAAVDWHQAAGGARPSAPTWLRTGLAGALAAAGAWDAAEEQAARLLTRDARSVDAWTMAGVAAARRGDRRRAARADAALGALAGPYRFGRPAYGRARIAALLGEPARAVGYLRAAGAQGARVAEWAHAEADLDPLRADPSFRALVRPGG